jgi:hypothetical protein
MIIIDEAIYKCYPNAVSCSAGKIAYDKDGQEITLDWQVINEKFAELNAQDTLDQCKDEAKKRIATTDWSVLPDVGISNTAEFEAYRAALRELIKNPVADPVWPTEPEPVWS